MATYTDLFDLLGNNDLLNRCAIAVLVKADTIVNDGTATDNEKAWATSVSGRSRSVAESVWPLVLAENKGATVAQITSATDAAIQTNVDTVVDGLVSITVVPS